MAREEARAKGERPPALAASRAPAASSRLKILPMQLLMGDRLADETGE
jgi:hypothetical protein